jgi:hypothetical protein
MASSTSRRTIVTTLIIDGKSQFTHGHSYSFILASPYTSILDERDPYAAMYEEAVELIQPWRRILPVDMNIISGWLANVLLLPMSRSRYPGTFDFLLILGRGIFICWTLVTKMGHRLMEQIFRRRSMKHFLI